jgi:hypothetical protein
VNEAGTTYDREQFGLLLLQKQYNERTAGESEVIRAFLLEHYAEFDKFTFNKRVGRGIEPDPSHLINVQSNTSFSSKLRIDILAWRGVQPVIIEVKQHVTPAALGQILTYRHYVIEEFPNAPDPELVVVGREGNEDAIVALQAHGVTVYLYPNAIARGNDAVGNL